MTDRIPGAPGRCKAVVTGEELQKLQSGEEFAITLRRDDQPIREGTPYNKENVLPDALAQQLCPTLSDPAPKDAFYALQTQKADTGRRQIGREIILEDGTDAPLLGLRILGSDYSGIGVGNGGSITLTVAGKNLADVQKFCANNNISNPSKTGALSNNYGTAISANSGTAVTVTQSKTSGSVSSYTNGFFTVGFYCPLQVGDTVTVSFEYKYDTNPLNTSVLTLFLNAQNLGQVYAVSGELWRYARTITITESNKPTDNWNYMEIRVGGKSGVFSNFQVEYGTAYTDYTPYKAINALTVPTPDGLLGNDEDYDEIDFARGVLIRRCIEQTETPLPADVLEAYGKLRSYAPLTRITNNANAKMEVVYCTSNTAVPMSHSPGDRGKFLAIDEGGAVALQAVDTYVEYTEKTDGWYCRIWSDGFAELYLTDTTNAGTYMNSCDPLFMLPIPVRSDATVQVTVPGKVFLTDYSLMDGTDLRLYLEGVDSAAALRISKIHIYIAGYISR